MSHRESIRGDFFKSGVRGFALVGLLLVAEAAAAGPTFVVNSLADIPAGPNVTDQICETATGNGVCTLRAAIMEANETRDAVVRVPAGYYVFTRAPTPGIHPDNGDLDVLSPMKIEGDGPSVSVIDAIALSRVFRIELALSTEQVEIRGLTIQSGRAVSNEEGGGILSLSRLLLENVHVVQNVASSTAGGIAAFGSLTMRHSIVERNTSLNNYGGGLVIGSPMPSRIENSRIENNGSFNSGAGLFLASGASLEIEGTAVVGNTNQNPEVSSGAGIHSFGNLVIVNSLLHGNRGFGKVQGSALLVSQGMADLIQVTVTKNDSGIGPYIGGAIIVGSEATVFLTRSIVTSNIEPGPQCVGPIISGDYNIVQDAFSCPMFGAVANNISVGGGFDVLSFNGGFSRDVSSRSTAAAGAVPAGACVDELGAPLTTDFRGYRRPSTACDIGAHDSSAVYKPAQLIGVNLLRNGGKAGQELGLANTTLAEDMQPPYWEQSGVVLQRLYGPGFPSLNDTPPGNGHKFLSGSLENATANQTIDVSALSAQIDAGTLAYQIGGSFGGESTENDNAAMTVLFYSDGFGFLDEFILGGFTAADRGNQTKLMPAQRNGTLPVGTRLIQVGVSFTRTDGFTNEAFADGLSVTLPEPGMAAGLAPAFIVLAALARRRRTLDT